MNYFKYLMIIAALCGSAARAQDSLNVRRLGLNDAPDRAYSVAVSGSYAYVPDRYGLRVFNVADPTNPLEAGFDSLFYATGIAISGNHAYVASASGLSIFDLTNPSDPGQLGLACSMVHAA